MKKSGIKDVTYSDYGIWKVLVKGKDEVLRALKEYTSCFVNVFRKDDGLCNMLSTRRRAQDYRYSEARSAIVEIKEDASEISIEQFQDHAGRTFRFQTQEQLHFDYTGKIVSFSVAYNVKDMHEVKPSDARYFYSLSVPENESSELVVNGEYFTVDVIHSGDVNIKPKLASRLVLLSDATEDIQDFREMLKCACVSFDFEKVTQDELVNKIACAHRDFTNKEGFESICLYTERSIDSDNGCEWTLAKNIRVNNSSEIKDPDSDIAKILRLYEMHAGMAGLVDLMGCSSVVNMIPRFEKTDLVPDSTPPPAFQNATTRIEMAKRTGWYRCNIYALL